MGAYVRAGAYQSVLAVGHIPFEVVLPISYFMVLHIQAIGCFLKDVRFVFN